MITEILEHGGLPVAVIRLEERMEVLSSAVLGGGHGITDTLFIMEVEKDYMHEDPMGHIRSVRDDLGLPPYSVGFMTAAEVRHVFSVAETVFEGVRTEAAATAGLSNQVVAGEVLDNWEERHRLSLERSARLLAGTINIIGVSPSALTDAAKMNIFIAMTEAKTAALNSLGYSETGTTSDSMAIVSPAGSDRVSYSGTGTPLGISMARSVRDAVRSSLVRRGDFPVPGTFMDGLRSHGVTEYDILSIVREGDPRVTRKEFDAVLDGMIRDRDVSALTQALLEMHRLDLLGCTYGSGDYPTHLTSHIILGSQLARAIAGEGAEERFLRLAEGPRRIRSQDGYLGAAVCGLAAGMMTKMSEGTIHER